MKSITGAAPPPSKFARRPTAFTLLELILVMAIVAIAVGMAIPTLHGFAQGRRTSNCVDQIVALTRFARTQAITRGVAYRLNLNPSDATYWLTVEQNDGRFGATGDSLGLQFKAPDGVRLSWNAPTQQDGGQSIQFQPNGRVDPAQIQVLAPDRQMFVIGCLSATEMYKILTPDEQRMVQSR